MPIDTPYELIDAVCDKAGITTRRLMAKKGKRDIAVSNVRYLIVRELRDNWKMKWRHIAEILNRDHHFIILVYRRGLLSNFKKPNEIKI